MLRSLAILLAAVAAAAGPAHADPVELMPNVTFDRTVQFTPHGVVVLNVITMPKPGGLYRLASVPAGGTIAGAPRRLTQIERDASATATVAGINGDFFDRRDGHPTGMVLSGGLLEHPPAAGRSSAGIDASGLLHVDRVKLYVDQGAADGWDAAALSQALSGLAGQPPETVLAADVKPRYAYLVVAPAASDAYVAASGKALKEKPVKIEVARPTRRR